jgi:hypothetical protein
MTREDADAFSSALRAAYPRLHFVSCEYWRTFVDWDAWNVACEEKERRERAGLPTERVRHRMRDPRNEPPRYWDSLGTRDERYFYGWVLPEGWVPEWGEEDNFGVRRINPPRLEFSFRRSHFRCWDRSRLRETVLFDDPPQPRNDNETIVLEDGHLSIQWNRYDDEAEAFAKVVFRTLFKQVIDRFITVSEDVTWRALSSTPWRNRRYGAAGRGAEAWALARRHNYFFSGCFEKPASFPFAPADVLSPQELASLKAKWDAKLEEAIAAQTRQDKELAEKWRREAKGR